MHNIAIWAKNGNMLCIPDKVEIQLLEVRIRGVELYIKIIIFSFVHFLV